MKKLNNFFFLIEDGEKLHPADVIYFYGGIGMFVAVGLIVLGVS